MELTRVRRLSPLDIDARVVDRALQEVDPPLCELDDRVLPVGVVGICGAVGEHDIPRLLEILEMFRDVRGEDQTVSDEGVRDLPDEERVLIAFCQGPDDVAPDGLVLADFLLRQLVHDRHNGLFLLSFSGIKDFVELFLDPVHDPDVVLPGDVDKRKVGFEVVELILDLRDLGGVLLVCLLERGERLLEEERERPHDKGAEEGSHRADEGGDLDGVHGAPSFTARGRAWASGPPGCLPAAPRRW